MTEIILDIGLDNIKGIESPKKAKLIAKGIDSTLELTVSLPKEIEGSISRSEESVQKLISAARQHPESHVIASAYTNVRLQITEKGLDGS